MGSVWVVRAGRGTENVDDFIEKGIVALGDKALGRLSPSMTKEDLLALYAQQYPNVKQGSRSTWASQFARFLSAISIEDAVVTFDRERRLYYLGEVVSEYEWAPQFIPEKPHARKVSWTHQVPRDLLSIDTRNTLGAIQTLFKLNPEAWDDLLKHQQPLGSIAETLTIPDESAFALESEDEAKAKLIEETINKADSFIEDAIGRLDWEQMQALVAGILRAMGYRTSVSERGPDRGVDIFASPDGLGLQEPRIFVEVKHRAGAMGSKEIRAFLGGRKQGDKCLYVSSGGFTKDALYEADRSSVPLKLLNSAELRKLLVEHYDRLDAETQALVPLRRLFWPVK